jgi:tripartite-type tricarboxylate transporter receptor subunit TctC
VIDVLIQYSGLAMRHFISSILASVFCLAGVLPSEAQEVYPNRPVRIVVPFAPGGSADILARIVAIPMSSLLGQPVVVENRGGGGGSLASAYVAQAPRDGYTLLWATLSTHGYNPHLYKNLTYDVEKDFAPITVLLNIPNVIAVHPDVPAQTLPQLIAHLKAKPGSVNYGSSGNGSTTHIGGELFKSMTGTDILHVPYKSSGGMLQALLANQIQVVFDPVPSSLSYIKSGRARALAVTSEKRLSILPDVPTTGEVGLPSYVTYTWNMLAAPAGTPAPVLKKLNEAGNQAIRDPATRARLEELSAIPLGTTEEEARAHLQAELKKWGPIIKASGAKVD